MRVNVITFYIVAFVLVVQCPLYQAMISQHSRHFRSRLLKSKSRVRLSVARADEPEIINKNARVEEEDPFGPPSVLASLKLQESYTPGYLMSDKADTTATSPLCITRLSSDPDIFLARNFVPTQQERDALIATAQQQGLKTAGTRQSEAQTVRKSSYLTWIDPYDLAITTNSDSDNEESSTTATKTARVMAELSQALFINEAVRSPLGLVTCEDLQVAKYDPTGCFDFHHDGLNRFVSVLTYLNGVGGTYFPLAQTNTQNNNNPDDCSLIPKLKRCYQVTIDEQELLSVEREFKVGQDGLLVVGMEGEDAYSLSKDISTGPNKEHAIVRIQPGDALVFYNSKFLWNKRTAIENYRAMHAGLRVPQEKWIATNWLRMK